MKKLDLIDLKDQVLSRDEMKTIMAGSGGGYACRYVVNNNSGWWGRLTGCETETESSVWEVSAVFGRGGGSGGGGYKNTRTTTTEKCYYTTYDPYNVGYERKVESVNGAVARQC